ncbi:MULTISPECIES: type III secretion system stator protein SctL [Pseudomonas]|uniref:type III secretion system stator protein SctL n=1 Tax=Pseudomonas TaxID=286 RepID=UPI001BEADDA4|nr:MULTISPECIES: type III secretion system stator protein SctL [Pseudomonas]MBT2340238.1 type III secretion system stator protein SctL [Pseudomonas fluorescens]MCD4530246.1 type III secretion system stator protein SctL [Pseudomonas sp. C3-2018]
MLARRSLELRPDGEGLLQPYVARETLVDCARAQGVLEQAQAHAALLLERASETAEAKVLEAQAQFWNRADTVLAAWEAQRQAMWEQIESSAARVVNEALQTLLDEVPDQARIDALVRQLAYRQRDPASATLRCHPDDLANLTRSLGGGGGRPWTPLADAAMARHQLRLETPAGTFLLDWPSAVEALQLPETQT